MKKLLCLTIMTIILIISAACNDNGDTPRPMYETITAAGTFWEDWWNTESELPGVVAGFSPLPPSSGFTTMADIEAYLLQLYTEAALEDIHLPFLEIDGVLHFADARIGTARFDWSRAHFEQIDENTVLASVLYGYFALEEGSYVDLTFHMAGGRIDRIEGGNIITAILDSHEQEQYIFEPWNEFTAQLEDGLLFIAPAFDSLLASFEYAHEVDYTEFIAMRDGERLEPWGDRIAIWSSTPLFQLEVINITGDFVDDEVVFVPNDSYGMIDVLYPGQVYLIVNYVGMGTLPWSGITFLDEQGERYYFFMQHDNSDSDNVFMIGQFRIMDENPNAE